MATSLAEQLRRLAAPQTTILKDSKKRASILFDAKEAATKDRETIYDIGRSGLDELIVLNPIFSQFEQTLFSQTAKVFERSVESSDVNKLLNKTIKKFMYHLSPYFLLEPTHKCLEWLIRRFHIQQFNKDEFMTLILPYHSTKMFVKCVQIMPLKNTQDPWHWLDVIRKPGIPLSKQVLFNRASSDQFLLKFICKNMVAAVKELDSKAYTLQTMFAFYCTTIVGALDVVADVTDAHVSHIFNAVIKGFSSNVTDYTASSLMITGQLVSKTKLSVKFLNAVISKLLKITHPAIQMDAILLLVLIFKLQNDVVRSLTNDSLRSIASSSSFTSLLGKIKSEGINVLPLYLPLLHGCLKKVQRKDEMWPSYKELCENLLVEVVFTENEAEDVIRCILDAYIMRDKNESNVITIESDSENVDMTEENIDINKWYSDILKKLERQYSDVFDRVIKAIMMEHPDDDQSTKKKSLKTVLGFLFTTACSNDGSNIFVNLYHYNARSRINAVKYLVKNFEKMSFSDDSKDLLKDSISERLNDDSPLVVAEVLKFKTRDLIRVVGPQMLANKLRKILQYILQQHLPMWDRATYLALGHLTSKELSARVNSIEILLAVCPFLYLESLPLDHCRLILGSEFVEKNSFLKEFRKYENASQIRNNFYRKLENQDGLPPIDDLVKMVNSLTNKELDVHTAFTTILIITYAIPSKCDDIRKLREILALVLRISMMFKKQLSNETFMIEKNHFPIPAALSCIQRIYESIAVSDLQRDLYVGAENPIFNLMRKIYEFFICGIFFQPSDQDLYGQAMMAFLKFTFQNNEKRIEFCSNYFMRQDAVLSTDEMDESDRIDEAMQIKSIRILNYTLSNAGDHNNITLNLSSLICILSGLCSDFTAIRMCTFETIEIMSKVTTIKPSYLTLLRNLLVRKEELLLDGNQLSLILFRIFGGSKRAKNELADLLNELIAFIANGKHPTIVKVLALELLKHINNASFLRKIAPTALDILEKYNDAAASPIFLPIHDSAIIRMIMYRYTPDTIESLQEYPECWTVILKSIQMYYLRIVDDNSKPKALTVLAIDLFDPSLFDQLTSNHRILFIESIVKSATFSENADIFSAVAKFIKKIDVDANECMNQLRAMKDIRTESAHSSRRKQKSQQTALMIDTFNTKEWKCGITWLEFLQNKKRLVNAHLLIPCLFDILNKCLEFENQSLSEYTKQLTLAAILHCCQIVSPTGMIKRDLIPENVFKIELVVQCIRGTQNAQTQHHALQLLSHTAAMIPDQVLMNMMEIFTFMGSTVIRRDDAYTYQIISNIIKSIIPTLIKANEMKTVEEQDALVIPVLKVFSGIILDVPVHRRVRLYVDLLTTLNTKQYLWMFLIVLFESHVWNYDKDGKKSDDGKRVFVAVELVNKFDSVIAIETCSKLIEFLYKQPFIIVRNEKLNLDIDITDSSLFKVDNYTDKQLRHFRYTVLQFISHLTKPSSELAMKISQLNDEAMLALKPYFKDIIVKSLQFLVKVIKTVDQQNTRYWKQFILHFSYDILEQIMALLSTDMLVQVVGGLLNNIPEVRRKAIELLNKKLQQPDFIGNCEKSSFLSLIEPLTNIIESINDSSKLCENATTMDNVVLQQHALISIKLLSINLGSEYPMEFTPILAILSAIIKKPADVPINVLSQTVLCLAEMCANLRAHSISHLSKFMPPLGKLLQKQVTTVTGTGLAPILASIYKIIETLPLFLSPYMINIIVSLSLIWSRISVADDLQKKSYIVAKLEAIWSKLASTLSIRVLVPMIERSYNQIIDEESYDAIGPLMKLLSERLASLTMQDVSPHQHDLTTFFMKALNFRCITNCELSVVNNQELYIIQAFVGFILKLSESSFRPLFIKVYEWGIKEEASVNSQITFYRLSNEIAESLKSLFILFAGDFIQNVADILIKYTNASIKSNNISTIVLLIESIIQTLYNIFLYDNQGFINNHRFDILMQPVVDQLENELIFNHPAKERVPQCLAEMARALNDDTMWKQLNYQILLKTRNNNADIRLFALEACVEVAKKLGDDFLPLLPETVPFLAELMEDESPIIEKKCQLSIQELEQVLGESLQKYF